MKKLLAVLVLGVSMISCSTPDAPTEVKPEKTGWDKVVLTSETTNPNEMISGQTTYQHSNNTLPITYNNRLFLFINSGSTVLNYSFRTLQTSQYEAVNITFGNINKMQKEIITEAYFEQGVKIESSASIVTIKKYYIGGTPTVDYIKITETITIGTYNLQIEYYKDGVLKYKGDTVKVAGN
jgi:hypothetical protein